MIRVNKLQGEGTMELFLLFTFRPKVSITELKVST